MTGVAGLCRLIIRLYVLYTEEPERLEKDGPDCLLKRRWMGTQRVQMKGALPCLVRWACRAGTRDFCSALAVLVGPEQNIFFLSPSPSKLGRQPCWVACLLVCVSGGNYTRLLPHVFKVALPPQYCTPPPAIQAIQVISWYTTTARWWYSDGKTWPYLNSAGGGGASSLVGTQLVLRWQNRTWKKRGGGGGWNRIRYSIEYLWGGGGGWIESAIQSNIFDWIRNRVLKSQHVSDEFPYFTWVNLSCLSWLYQFGTRLYLQNILFRIEEYFLFILGRIEDYVPGSPSPIQTDMEVSDKPKGGGPVSFNRNFSCNLNFANRFFDLAILCNLTYFRVFFIYNMVMDFWTLEQRKQFQDLFFFSVRSRNSLWCL